MHKIGIIAADQFDFMEFCKEYGFSLGRELVVNLLTYEQAVETPIAYLYVTMKAQEERKDMCKIRDLFISNLKMNSYVAINLCEGALCQ